MSHTLKFLYLFTHEPSIFAITNTLIIDRTLFGIVDSGEKSELPASCFIHHCITSLMKIPVHKFWTARLFLSSDDGCSEYGKNPEKWATALRSASPWWHKWDLWGGRCLSCLSYLFSTTSCHTAKASMFSTHLKTLWSQLPPLLPTTA